MKYLLLMALSFFVAGNTYAGIDKGNGGDATAQSFVDIMNKVYLFLEENPKVLVKASRIEVKKAVKTLQESLGNTAKPSLVEVTLRRPRDKFDVEKAIITTVSPLKVLLHKDSWEQPTNLDINQVKKDQVTLAAMEILLLSGIYEDRYQLAYTKIGQRYDEVLKMAEMPGRKLPPFPENAKPLQKEMTGSNFVLFNDTVLQALKNTAFKDCTYEIELKDNYWFVNFYHNDGSFMYRIERGIESLNRKQISWDGGKKIRMRYNAKPTREGGLVVGPTWDDPIEGIMSYTIVLSEDESEVKSIEFASYILKNLNKGTPLQPKMDLVWEEILMGRTCHQ